MKILWHGDGSGTCTLESSEKRSIDGFVTLLIIPSFSCGQRYETNSPLNIITSIAYFVLAFQDSQTCELDLLFKQGHVIFYMHIIAFKY